MGAMSVNLKTPQEIEMMRIAGRLASEVLDIVTPTSSPVSPLRSWTASATTTS